MPVQYNPYSIMMYYIAQDDMYYLALMLTTPVVKLFPKNQWSAEQLLALQHTALLQYHICILAGFGCCYDAIGLFCFLVKRETL